MPQQRYLLPSFCSHGQKQEKHLYKLNQFYHYREKNCYLLGCVCTCAQSTCASSYALVCNCLLLGKKQELLEFAMHAVEILTKSHVIPPVKVQSGIQLQSKIPNRRCQHVNLVGKIPMFRCLNPETSPAPSALRQSNQSLILGVTKKL